jgi:NAD(P)-dependent dehydrogenase (short-subunit alcohol dehydrogenase family)
MSATITAPGIELKPELLNQTVVAIGGSSGIGLETARRARAQGAKLILAGRQPETLQLAASEVYALSTKAFDATDPARLAQFFRDLAGTINHVMVTAGRPYYGRLIDMDSAEASRALSERFLLFLDIARNAAPKMRPGGTLIFMGDAPGRRPALGNGAESTVAVALPALIANLALEVAPVRVNLIAAGFVDSPLSASVLGDQLESRRARRAHHDQHGPHRWDLRYRWWSAVRGCLAQKTIQSEEFEHASRRCARKCFSGLRAARSHGESVQAQRATG